MQENGGFFNNKNEKKTNKNHPEGEKQTGNKITAVRADIPYTRRKTTDQHRTGDTWRIYGETNEEDTGETTETITR